MERKRGSLSAPKRSQVESAAALLFIASAAEFGVVDLVFASSVQAAVHP